MSSMVERVRKLIALAGSSNEHEGRSAAAMACRLIRDHNLAVTDPSPAARREPRAPEAPRRYTRGPYSRVRAVRGGQCRECGEPIAEGEVFHDAEATPVHGDCIPRGERP